MVFKYNDAGYIIYGFLILAGSLLLAALIRMFANIGQMFFDVRVDLQNSVRDIGQMIFDIRVDMQNSSRDTQDSFRQAKESGESRHESLIRCLQSLAERLGSIKDNFDQMNCDSRDMNQNIHQIRDFFEKIERHLDLKK